jgi:hypothetical protein
VQQSQLTFTMLFEAQGQVGYLIVDRAKAADIHTRRGGCRTEHLDAGIRALSFENEKCRSV